MPALDNDLVISLGLGLSAAYFTVQTLSALWRVWRAVAMWPAALVTWPARGPSPRTLWTVFGAIGAALAVWESFLGTHWLHVFSMAVMAFYFLAVPRLLRTVQLGFYQSGIWTEETFVPYDRIARWSFAETPEVVLMVLLRGNNRAAHLAIPGEEYGAARRILQDQLRNDVLHPDDSILDLEPR